MEFTLEKVLPWQKSTLLQLLELYFYDFTEFKNFEVNEKGRFDLMRTGVGSYLRQKERHSFFIRVKGQLAGFVLVSRMPEEEETTHSLDEFFILKKYRRKHLGREVAWRVFDRFPGRWTLMQIEENKPAIAFWRQVIAQYTEGPFEETFENGVYAQWFQSKQFERNSD